MTISSLLNNKSRTRVCVCVLVEGQAAVQLLCVYHSSNRWPSILWVCLASVRKCEQACGFEPWGCFLFLSPGFQAFVTHIKCCQWHYFLAFISSYSLHKSLLLWLWLCDTGLSHLVSGFGSVSPWFCYVAFKHSNRGLLCSADTSGSMASAPVTTRIIYALCFSLSSYKAANILPILSDVSLYSEKDLRNPSAMMFLSVAS